MMIDPNISEPVQSASKFDMGRQSQIGYILVAFLFLLIVVWGGLAQISGAVLAQGRIVLASSIKKVQHREGGIVREISVHEGQEVQVGQVLVRLDSTVADADENVVAEQLWQLNARKMRLEAERDRRGPSTLTLQPSSPAGYSTILAAERELMIFRSAMNQQKKSQLEEQIVQSQHEISGLGAQVDALTQQASLIDRELISIRDLYKKGYAPFTRVSELEREAQRLAGQKGELTASIARAHAQQAQIREQVLQVDSERLTEIMADLKDTETRLGQLRGQEITTSDISQRIDIRAPVTGKIQQLSVHTQGGVVMPGETLMLIVPESDKLIVEARIDPQKVDNVHVGSRAHVRFTAFDTRTTPESLARVDSVASDIEVDEKTGASFYRARLELGNVKVSPQIRQSLVAGMPVEVQIETGSRSAISYFLKPLSDQLSRTFRDQ
jgi:HlyD family secretion protein